MRVSAGVPRSLCSSQGSGSVTPGDVSTMASVAVSAQVEVRVWAARVHSIPLPGRGEIGSVIGLWRCQPEEKVESEGAGRVHSIPVHPEADPRGGRPRRVRRCGASSASRCTGSRRPVRSRRPYPSASRQSQRRSGSRARRHRARGGGRASAACPCGRAVRRG